MRATKILQRILTGFLSEIHEARLNSVFWAVHSLLIGGRLALTAIGRSARGETYPKHCIKRVDRLLGNKLLHKERDYFYRAIARMMIGAKKRPLVIIDWTGIGKKHSALVAAVPIDGRSVPIYCRVYSIKKNNNPVIHKKFLSKLRSILPEGCCPIIVTDAGFQNAWFFEVVSWGWDFVGRIITNATARTLEDRNWFPVLDLYKRATFVAKDLGRHIVSKATPACLRLVTIKEKSKKQKTKCIGRRPAKDAQKRARQPWLLATSLADTTAKKIVHIYSMRFQIEESFRDAKNLRFGFCFKHARSNSKERLEILMLIAVLGMIALNIVGQCGEKAGMQKRYQANTITSHRVLSLFFLGKNIILFGHDTRFTNRDLLLSIEHFKEKLPCYEEEIASIFLGIT